MSRSREVVGGADLTGGDEAAEPSAVAFTFANGGMTSGLKVAIFLTGNGIDPVRKRAIGNLVVHPPEPLAARVKDFFALATQQTALGCRQLRIDERGGGPT